MAPKFNMNKNPVYQVEFSVLSSGRKVALTKRRVRWVFGYSNAEAIESGATGVECRGEEHEVVLIWSLASSKRTLRIDGEDIHYSVGRLSDTKFEFSYPVRGGHFLKVIAHFLPPIMSKPDFRQFDLQLDGLSFFDMPRVFQLGQTSPMKALTLPRYVSEWKSSSQSEMRPYSNYKLEGPDDFAKPRAVTDSAPKPSHQVTIPPKSIDLLSSPSVNPIVDSAAAARNVSLPFASTDLSVNPVVNRIPDDMSRSNSVSSNPRPSQIYVPASDNITKQVSYDDFSRNRSSSYAESVQTKSSYNDIRNMILDCYELSSPPSLAMSEDLTRSQDSSSPSFASYREDSPTQEMRYEERSRSEYASSNLDSAFHNLVNLNNISKLTAVAPKPVEPSMSLNELKQTSSGKSTGMQHPAKEVMKPSFSNISQPTYGAMVPYGYNSTYMVEPPPLSKVSGFGVGVTHVYDTRFENRSGYVAPYAWNN